VLAGQKPHLRRSRLGVLDVDQARKWPLFGEVPDIKFMG
jgi:hypothetical protein